MIDTKAGNKGGGEKKNQFRERDLEEGELRVLVDLTRNGVSLLERERYA